MVNYYEILEIRADSTREDVKAAFRSLAKKYHPDFHPERSKWAHDRMHEILRAYEVLIDDEKRVVYDRTLSHLESLRRPSCRENLKRKASEPAACCRLIFLDLLEGRGAEGVALYERLSSSNPQFQIKDYMKIGDRLDCEFLLAEEYERQKKNEIAFEMYGRIYTEDQRYNYFGHFREEILLRMRNLILLFLETKGSLPLALRSFSQYLRDGLRRQERAFIYKKMAESFLRAGEERLARLTFLIALQLHPKLGGIKKLSLKLRMQRRCLK
ncbi:MAG: DnaJ domain-containing protein [Candidatus Aureabacteria bacterium]|nr:DnaJ domain-containing protein [Candidatus Auribacterota bacterium]